MPAQEVVTERPSGDVPGHELDGRADHAQPGEGVAAARLLHDAAAVGTGHQVVAVVVGDHGDRLGVAVRVDGEDDVLADPERLVEHDAVADEQLAAEQLEAGERVVDGGLAERGAFAVLPEHGGGNLAAVADHLAEDDVGAVAVGHREHALQRLGAEVVVGIAEEDITPAGLGDRAVPRLAGAARGLLVRHPYFRIFRRILGEKISAAVGGAVIDDDDLLADALLQQRGEAPVEIGAAVVDGHHDAHVDAPTTFRLHCDSLCNRRPAPRGPINALASPALPAYLAMWAYYLFARVTSPQRR